MYRCHSTTAISSVSNPSNTTSLEPHRRGLPTGCLRIERVEVWMTWMMLDFCQLIGGPVKNYKSLKTIGTLKLQV